MLHYLHFCIAAGLNRSAHEQAGDVLGVGKFMAVE